MHHLTLPGAGLSPSDIDHQMNLQPEVRNRFYDLLVNDEELQAAASQAYDSVTHMHSRLKTLDEDHPAYYPLLETFTGLVSLEEREDSSYRFALEAIEKLNQNQFMGSTEAFIAVSGVIFGLAAPSPFAVPGLVAAGLTVGRASADSAVDVINTRSVIAACLDNASRIIARRDEFDAIWSRLVETEA